MSSPRVWISILTLVSFLAGVAAGLVGGEYSRRTEVPERAFGDFEQRFVEKFDLDPAGQRLLADLLAHYNSEIDQIKDRHAAENRSQMQDEMQEVGEAYRSDVRALLVSESQRLEFDRSMTDYDNVKNS